MIINILIFLFSNINILWLLEEGEEERKIQEKIYIDVGV
jgi:hypothetical protein